MRTAVPGKAEATLPARPSARPTVLFGLALALGAAFGSTAPADPLPKDIKLPTAVSLAIYMPPQVRRHREAYQGRLGGSQTQEDTVLSVAQIFFTDSHMVQAGSDTKFGLLLSLHPDLKFDAGSLTYTLSYSVFAGEDTALAGGTRTVTISASDFTQGDPLNRASLQAVQQAMQDVVTMLRPDAAKYPASHDLTSRPLDFVARMDKPWGNGTGFYFNAAGQILTAAHVIQDCAKVDIKQDDKVLPARIIARSNVVDLAALDTGVSTKSFLSFRRDSTLELGEAVSNVGYPLQSLLSPNPSLTRGNISARGGLVGSQGQIQFSAPVQPGSSGGPVVSDSGEVLGVTVGTLSATALAREGVIPQNVNFALEARYALKFLKRNGLDFSAVEPKGPAAARDASQALLAAVVDVECYE